MSYDEKVLRRLGLAVALAVAFFAAHSVAAQTKAPHRQSWKVKDTNERLSLGEDHLTIIPRHGPLEVIAFNGIIGVFHDNLPQRPVAEAMDYEIGLGSGDPGEFYADAAGVAAKFLMLPFAWITTHRDYVSIVWKDGDRVRSRSFRLNKAGAESLLSALAAASGRNWADLDFPQRLKRGDFRHLNIRLPSPATVGETRLLPGEYPLAVMEIGDGTALICFFSNYTFEPKDLVVVVGARVSPLQTEEYSRGILTADESGKIRLTEIRLGLTSYQIIPTRRPQASSGTIPAVKP